MLLILITFMLSKPIARKHFQKKKNYILTSFFNCLIFPYMEKRSKLF